MYSMIYPSQLDPDQQAELEFLLASGINDVQTALAPSGLLTNTDHPATPLSAEQLSLGLNRLTIIENALGVVGLTKPVEDIFRTESYPRTPIVEGMILSVAATPVASFEQKSRFKDIWVEASSSGSGRIYPACWIARHSAAQIIQKIR